MARYLLLSLVTLLLTGCGSMNPINWLASDEPSDPPAELTELQNQIAIRQLWNSSLGSGTDQKRIKLVPSLDLGRLYIAARKGEVAALDADTGKKIWELDTELEISGGPGVGEGLVLIGTSDAELVALDAESGAERWRARVSSEILSVPKVAAGVAVVHTVDGKLFGFDALDGTQLWIYDRSVPVLTLHGSSSPVISGDLVICGFASGKLVGVDLASGGVRWETNLSVPSGRSELERLVDIDGDPLAVGNAIFVTSYQGDMAAVARENGQVYWRKKLSSFVGPGADWRALYVADAEGQVWSIQPNSGAALWKNDKLLNRWLSPPVVLGDYVVVGDFEGYVHWLSTSDGRLVGRVRVGDDPISSAPVVYNDRLYIYSDGGTLAAMTLLDNTPAGSSGSGN
ncbi:MAG: outer membrane protein assembly factor BamB [Chromatiaceae bacterium]|nr:outer membrane protein assembly factor BamB [Gammaproteobacteria bacterium]MCP5448222.1 outer membrane protein assembly factor BamB [Chromatiaceae bacterium]MCB1860607.1 outer membrane protein assembly factor BamB [Gammaproteobacteria bacterium]MCB1873581.1 outer membrane protein assembly factor BamB [Gammaproteobacteria bacterium]MCB1880133.1 outer membrane protein assembly factor BamB [Gammaproteobacteria bacterium]